MRDESSLLSILYIFEHKGKINFGILFRAKKLNFRTKCAVFTRINEKLTENAFNSLGDVQGRTHNYIIAPKG